MPEKFSSSKEDGKIFVGGLTYNTTDEMLRQYFSQWGDLIDYIVMKDPDTKRSRGFGFVTYSSPECVDVALEQKPHTIDGKTVEAKKALPRDSQTAPAAKPQPSGPVKRLYISGVREDHTEEAFREHFSKYGKIVSIDIIADKATGKKRGFAYVTFESCDAVDKCVVTRSHMIDGKRCDVKKALSRDEMQKSDQYGRDRQERDSRSRGAGRNDGYNNYGGYSSGAAGTYGNGYGTYNGPANNWPSGGAGWNQGAASGGAGGNYYSGYPGSGTSAGGYGGYAGATPASNYGSSAPNYGSNVGSYGPAGNYSANPPAAPVGPYTAPGTVATPGYNPPGTYSTSNWNSGAASNWPAQQAPNPAPTGWGAPQPGAVPPGWSSQQQAPGPGAQAAQAAANWSQSAQNWQSNMPNSWSQGPGRGAPSAQTWPTQAGGTSGRR